MIVPVLPVVAETDAAARAIVDRLLLLVPLAEDAPGRGIPAARSLGAFLEVAGIADAGGLRVDGPVEPRLAARFAEPAARTLALVAERTGRRIGGQDPVTWRHLIAAHAVPAAFVVGDANRIADHFERWRDEGAADGFNVLSAFQPAQFEAFTQLAAPELRRRGLLGRRGETLRERLGVGAPRLVHDRARAFIA